MTGVTECEWGRDLAYATMSCALVWVSEGVGKWIIEKKVARRKNGAEPTETRLHESVHPLLVQDGRLPQHQLPQAVDAHGDGLGGAPVCRHVFFLINKKKVGCRGCGVFVCVLKKPNGGGGGCGGCCGCGGVKVWWWWLLPAAMDSEEHRSAVGYRYRTNVGGGCCGYCGGSCGCGGGGCGCFVLLCGGCTPTPTPTHTPTHPYLHIMYTYVNKSELPYAKARTGDEGVGDVLEQGRHVLGGHELVAGLVVAGWVDVSEGVRE